MKTSVLNPTLVTLAMSLAGCAATPQYDAKFGEAVRTARLQQTINPNAGKAEAPAPSGLDGKAAQESIERYHDSFKAPPPAVNVINIGGNIAGGK
jgi:hypothetical protein